jgi:hypothetical protein
MAGRAHGALGVGTGVLSRLAILCAGLRSAPRGAAACMPRSCRRPLAPVLRPANSLPANSRAPGPIQIRTPPQIKELTEKLAIAEKEAESLRNAADTAAASAAARQAEVERRDEDARRQEAKHAADKEASAAQQAAMRAEMEALSEKLDGMKAQNDELGLKLAETGRKLRVANNNFEAARASMARQTAARRKGKNGAWLANKRIRGLAVVVQHLDAARQAEEVRAAACTRGSAAGACTSERAPRACQPQRSNDMPGSRPVLPARTPAPACWPRARPSTPRPWRRLPPPTQRRCRSRRHATPQRWPPRRRAWPVQLVQVGEGLRGQSHCCIQDAPS